MGLDTSFIGRAGGRSRIVVERGPVANFARAVKDDNPVYLDERAARDAGFDGIPVPPTFPFVAQFWGSFPENQPEDAGVNPVGEVIAEYHKMGGLILHGEQAFTYHRPVKVGDVLDTETRITDLYEKESGSSTMTFTVAETTFTDAATGELVLTTRSNFINRR
jgi:acyl dehydratase